MITDINNALETLEQSLSGINSAKEQVEKNVQAFEAVGIEIKNYSNSLRAVSQNLNDVIELVRTRRNELGEEAGQILENLRLSTAEVLSKNRTMLDNVKTDFVEKTQPVVNKMNAALSDFEAKVDRLETLISDIERSLAGVTSIKEEICSLKEEISESFKSQNLLMNNISANIQSVIAKRKDTDSVIHKQTKTIIILSAINILIVVIVAALVLIH